MKLPKKLPKATVRVYPDGKDSYKMIVMKPQVLATFTQKGSNWITEDGKIHRTHRDAMRHIAMQLKDKELMKAVPGPVRSSRPEKPLLQFQTPQDVLRYAVTQDDFTKFLLHALDHYTKPQKEVEHVDTGREDQAM